MLVRPNKFFSLVKRKKMSTSASPDRKKSRSLVRVVSSEEEDSSSRSPVRDQDHDGSAIYACKSSKHTIEHVYNLNRQDLREIHWKECVLGTAPEGLAQTLASAEVCDCLSTVSLTWAGKGWGTTLTEAQLRALEEGQSAQVMDDVYQWETLGEENELDDLLTGNLRAEDDLKKLYEISCYRKEARNRLRAVRHIVDRIPEADQSLIKRNDVLYKLMESKLRDETKEQRTDLLEKVSLYHWFLKTDLTNLTRIPLV